jgi:nitroreductase
MVDMNFEDTVRNRRSVRGFLQKPVPQDLMNKVFEIAQLSPSGTNIQPWQAYVASGEVRDKLREEFVTRVQAKVAANPDRPDKGRLGDPWKERRRGCARVLFDSMGIEWEDKAGRAAASFRNFEMFDAPHVVFIGMNEIFGAQTAADVGMYAQTLMLAMTANGLASCAQGTMAHYPDLVRETFDIPEDVKILFGISFGFEDVTIPANKAVTTRASLEESVQFLG